MKNILQETDPQISDLIAAERQRQEFEINLIASENYASQAVLEATGSMLTNKYAEGYPGKRYYGGCLIVDQVEEEARNRCKTLFNAEYANVQPHAGSQANMAAYEALLNPGDTILGMSLAMGGHLTHGHSVNFSGKWYKAVQYGVDAETHLINYDEVERLAREHRPKLIIAGASAYSRIIDFEKFARIARSVGAYFMVDMAHIAGLVAAKVHPSPFPHADIVTSTTHKTLRGPRGAFILAKAELGERIDRAIMPGLQGGPFMHTIAAKAVGFREAQTKEFIAYQEQVVANAKAMAKTFSDLGYHVVAGGTDNHLFTLNLRKSEERDGRPNRNGRAGEIILGQTGIAVSRSCVPFDQESPWITSGIRIGTAAITTRGMSQTEAISIALLIDDAFKLSNDQTKFDALREEVKLICKKFPLKYPNPPPEYPDLFDCFLRKDRRETSSSY